MTKEAFTLKMEAFSVATQQLEGSWTINYCNRNVGIRVKCYFPYSYILEREKGLPGSGNLRDIS